MMELSKPPLEGLFFVDELSKTGRHLIILFALLLIAVPALAYEDDDWTCAPIGELVPVDYVRTIDGDTIVVSQDGGGPFSVRLFALDAPELEEGTSEAFESSYALAMVMEAMVDGNHQVYLEIDPIAGNDPWGRTLAWIWLGMSEHLGDVALLNTGCIKSGYADYYIKCTSHLYDDQIQAALALREHR